jgi:hypothetical protein
MSKIEGYKCDMCQKVFVKGEKNSYSEPSSATIDIRTSIEVNDTHIDLVHICSGCVGTLSRTIKAAITNAPQLHRPEAI